MLLTDVHLQGRPDKRLRAYIVLDDQRNRTLASSQLFDSFEIEGEDVDYILTSCAEKERGAGRKVNGVVVEPMYQHVRFQLPAVTESSHLPNNRKEIPTQKIAPNYAHLYDLAPYIPPLDESALIMLLIGSYVMF